jgi:hypothetical protein
MSATSFEMLIEDIRRVKRRRIRRLTLREISLGIVLTAALFMALGLLEMTFQFPPAGRIVLTGFLAVAVGVFVWRRFQIRRQMRLDDQRIAHYIEEHFPELEQRLITSMEFGENAKTAGSPLLVEKLWEDTAARLGTLDIAPVATVRNAWPAAGTAVLMIGALTFAIWHWGDFSRAGRRLLIPWDRTGATEAAPVELAVQPGTIRIQRGNDVMLVASIENAVPKQVDLHLNSGPAGWRRIPMTREGAAHTYVHFLSSVQDDVTYYVDIGVQRSDEYRIAVFDMPRVEQIAVDYAYPDYTGLQNKTVRNRGDVTAPAGTRITLHAVFNKAVARAAIQFGDGTTLGLEPDGTTRTSASGTFIVTHDSTYTIKVTDAEKLENEDPYEYLVRSIPDSPPVLTPIRPGRDRKVMSLEEVAIAATAEDDYGLAKFSLNYMVAGSENREISFIAAPQQQLNVSVQGETNIYLEDLDVAPGDFIVYYLTALDNNPLKDASEVTSDIYFLEVVPTEEQFRRAPQMGGGGGSGGGGRSSSALVENQKNIIAATWKLLKQRKMLSAEKFRENLQTLTESQQEVMQRAQLSLRRLSERVLFSDESYKRAVEHLKQAIIHMQTAVENLASEQIKDALGPEQAALQGIMKAEAESRNTMIQMARSRGAGGGNRQPGEREDLRELFEMEMGRLENRYELPRQAGGIQQGDEKEDTLAKLRELARRQERLNRRQKDLARRRDQMSAEQKQRRLEELRREQEELRRQAEEMSRQMSRLAQQGGFRQWSDRQRQLEEAARRMQEAARGLGRQEPDTALAQGQKAFEHLSNQERELSLDQQATVSSLINSLKRKARDLQAREKQILKNLAEATREFDRETQTEEQLLRAIKEVIVDKDKIQNELAEAEDMLQTVRKKGRQDQPEIADRAADAVQAMKTEGIAARIEESRKMLEAGWLNPSMDAEKKIEQSIARVAKRFQDLDRATPRTREEQLRQAAADAEGLRRELENLKQQIETLRQNNRQGPGISSSGEPSQHQPAGTAADEGGRGLDRMRDSLERSRRYAQGLVQPWARGERWGVDARSIQRALTRKEVEDFLSQPELWQRLLAPARELETALRAEANAGQLEKKLFLTPEETVPSPYRHLVEEYYRDLSRVTTEKGS